MHFKHLPLVPQKYYSYLHKIVDLCNSYDNLINPFFYEEDEEYLFSHHGFFYCTDSENNIIGFISLSGISETEFEACGFVLPEFRGQGIFSALLKKVKEEFRSTSVSLLVNPDCTHSVDILHHYNFLHLNTECKMILEFTDTDIFSSELSLDSQEIAPDIWNCTFFNDSVKIGTCTISIVDNSYCMLGDVEIKKEYRGLGLGIPLIHCLCNYLKVQGIFKIILHVTKGNVPAYRLYKSTGFTIVSKLDYYQLSVS